MPAALAAAAASRIAIPTNNPQQNDKHHNPIISNSHNHTDNDIGSRNLHSLSVVASIPKKTCLHAAGPYGKGICIGHTVMHSPAFLDRIAQTHAMLGEAVVIVSS